MNDNIIANNYDNDNVLIRLNGKVPIDKGWNETLTTSSNILDGTFDGNVGWLVGGLDLVVDIDFVPKAKALEGKSEAEIEVIKGLRQKELYEVLQMLGWEGTPVDFADEYKVVRTQHGCHVYCSVESEDMLEGVCKKLRGYHVDLFCKALGGRSNMVVAVGSKRADGKLYEWMGLGREVLKLNSGMNRFWTLAKKPRELVTLLEGSGFGDADGVEGEFIGRGDEVGEGEDAGKVRIFSERQIKLALSHIDVDGYAADYEGWLQIAMGVHSGSGGDDYGWKVFIAWCRSGQAHGPVDERIVRQKWDSFNKHDSGIRFETIMGIVYGLYPKGHIERNRFTRGMAPESPDRIKRISDEFMTKVEVIIDASGKLHRFNGRFWQTCAVEFLGTLIVRYLSDDDQRWLFEESDEAPKPMGMDILHGKMSGLIRNEIRTDTPIGDSCNLDGLALKNGTLYNMERFVEAWDAKDYIDRGIDIIYDPEAVCLEFDKVMGTSTDCADYLWEVFAHMLQPHKNDPFVLVLEGGGSNGKSLILSVMMKIFGGYTHSLAHNKLNSNIVNKHVGAEFVGMRMSVVDDTGSNFRLSPDIIKMMGETKRMSADGKGLKVFDFDMRSSLVVATNQLSQVERLDHGTIRRLRLVPFPNTFKGEKDPELGARIIKNELSGVLNRLLAARARTVARGHLEVPKVVTEAVERWVTQTNPVAGFVNEYLTSSDGSVISSSTMYERYRNFIARSSGDGKGKPVNVREFSTQMQQLGQVGGQRRIDGKMTRLWENVKISDIEL